MPWPLTSKAYRAPDVGTRVVRRACYCTAATAGFAPQRSLMRTQTILSALWATTSSNLLLSLMNKFTVHNTILVTGVAQ